MAQPAMHNCFKTETNMFSAEQKIRTKMAQNVATGAKPVLNRNNG